MNNSLWFYSDTQQTLGPMVAKQLIAIIQAGQLVARKHTVLHPAAR
jgi:hypothetical protein